MLDFILNFFKSTNRVKVPTILQMEATECGAASLSMIFAHYGLWLPLEKQEFLRRRRIRQKRLIFILREE